MLAATKAASPLRTCRLITPEAAPKDSELHGVMGTAGGDEGRFTTADLPVTSEAVATNSQVDGASGDACGDEGRITTVDLQVTPEAAPMKSELYGVTGNAGGDEGRITTADLQVTPEAVPMNLEPQGVMDGEGDAKERGVRGLYKGDSKGLDMAAQDTTTLLKEFPLVGHRGVVGSPVAHCRGRQRGQAKAAAVPVGLVGNRYAVLAEAREDVMLAGAEVCAVQENSGVAELIPQARGCPCSAAGGRAFRRGCGRAGSFSAGLEQASQESGSRGGC